MALTALNLGIRVNPTRGCLCSGGAAIGLGRRLICIHQVRPFLQDQNQVLFGIDP